MERVSNEVQSILKQWIQQEYSNDELFDTISSHLSDAFQSSQAFHNAKKDILRFIRESIPDAQKLFAINTKQHSTDEKIILLRAEKDRMRGRIYNLYLKIGKKLGYFNLTTNSINPSSNTTSKPNQDNTSEDANTNDGIVVEEQLDTITSEDEKCLMCMTPEKDLKPLTLIATKCCKFAICLTCYINNTKNFNFNCTHCQKQTYFCGDTNDIICMMGILATKKLREVIKNKIDDMKQINHEKKIPETKVYISDDDEEAEEAEDVEECQDRSKQSSVKRIKLNNEDTDDDNSNDNDDDDDVQSQPEMEKTSVELDKLMDNYLGSSYYYNLGAIPVLNATTTTSSNSTVLKKIQLRLNVNQLLKEKNVYDSIVPDVFKNQMEIVPEICLNVERVENRFVIAVVIDKKRKIEDNSVEGVENDFEVFFN